MLTRACQLLNMGPVQVSSRIKFLLPVAGVLVLGLFVFLGVTISLHAEAGQLVILVAAAGAVVVCAVVLIVWAVLIQRPLVEMQDKMARLRAGDMDVSVSFAAQKDEIGELGRNFNETVRQLRESREEVQRLYRTQMSRAEHPVPPGPDPLPKPPPGPGPGRGGDPGGLPRGLAHRQQVRP